jgi:hypothetical protein
MPTLPLFAAGGFRQWMAGNNPQVSVHTPAQTRLITDSKVQSAQCTRSREDGLRGSDESASLHDK